MIGLDHVFLRVTRLKKREESRECKKMLPSHFQAT